MSESVALFDLDGRVVGAAPRTRVRAENLRHGASCVLVLDGQGRVFVHRRTATKDLYPGRLDFLAGGVLQRGEDPLSSAIRELDEELGVSGVVLTDHGWAHYADEKTDYIGFRYECRWDGPMRLDPAEVASGEWLTVAETLRRIDDKGFRFMPDSVALMRWRLEELEAQPE